MTADDADEVLLDTVRLAMGISVRAADAVGADVSPVQLRALKAVSADPGGNLGRLAETLGVALSTASRLVERLVSAGMVDRRTSEVNRREVTLRLTELGASTLSHYDAMRLEGMQRVLDQLSPDERDVVMTGLRLLTQGERASTGLASPNAR